MYLDEELEQIYAQEGHDPHRKAILLLECLTNRLPQPDAATQPDVLFTEMKRIDNGWRLFCSRHSEYNPDGWRSWCLRSDPSGKLADILGWNKN